MSRLKRVANNIDDAKTLLERINKASDDLKDIYYILFDNLNVLYQNYPDLYKAINMVVKLPTNDDATFISNFNNDLKEILKHFNDEQYLSEYVEHLD